jgi:hypothetical protein
MLHLINKTIIAILFIGVLAVFSFIFWISTLTAESNDIVWGVTFSDSQATYLGLNPDEVYTALIKDLNVKHIKLHVNWNATEKSHGVLDFDTLDRRIQEAEANDVKLILVIGMKTGRWPECHTPKWFLKVPPENRQAEIVRYVSTIVGRYAESDAIEFWQIENEPFLEFGTCPDWYYEENLTLLQNEINAVRALDPDRKIIISESGELSTWTKGAEMADIVGVTLYRSTWNSTEETFGINPYTFLTPKFYIAKSAFIKSVYQKPVISIELQAEPWASRGLAEASLAEQEKSMNPELFAENIAFARETGFGAYYFWGAEWWYWMKTRHNQPEIWEQAKVLFNE